MSSQLLEKYHFTNLCLKVVINAIVISDICNISSKNVSSSTFLTINVENISRGIAFNANYEGSSSIY